MKNFIWQVLTMKRKALIIGMILIAMIFFFGGCKSTEKTPGKAADAAVQSKVPDNLKLVSATKVDADDMLYVYYDQTYHTEIYVCKNLKTNSVSIATGK